MSTPTDQLWLAAEQEADNAEQRNAALWARCFAQAEGDASKAKALYMNERVRQITGVSTKSKEMGWLRWLGLTALVLVSGFFILAKLLPDDPSADQRAAIDLCWKDHQNPALDEATKRFVASTCQSMEADYLKKHGRNP